MRSIAALLIALAAVAHADTIHVRGSWQATLVCGSFGDAAVVFQLDQDVGTGEVSATAGTPCGTVAFFPTLPITSCATTPAVVAGQVSGSSLVLPDAGTFATESFVPPFGGCPVERITTEQSLAGAITDDGAGRATAIDGTLVTASVALRRADGFVCSSFGPEIPDCTLAMRRNDLPVGADVAVAPLDGFAFVASTVTSPGALVAGPTTVQRAAFPPVFTALQIGEDRRFWDLVTSAGIVGPLGVCIDYPDADDDGFYDGAFRLSERRLSVMQAEAGVYVDRTVSRDPLANRVCGSLPTLAQVTLGTPYTLGPIVDRPIGASALKLLAMGAGRSRLVFKTKDPMLLTPADGSVDDPATGDPGGMILEVFASPVGGGPARRGLDVLEDWTSSRPGRWEHRFQRPSTGRDKATLTAGKGLSIVFQDALVPLDAPIGRAAVRVQLGALRSCALFTEAAVRRDDAGKFVAAKTAAPALPDCADATLAAAVTP